jgi:hypothetical protein
MLNKRNNSRSQVNLKIDVHVYKDKRKK